MVTPVSESTRHDPGLAGTGPRSSLERVRRALEASGCRLDLRGPTHFMSTCPVHDDHKPSLHVSWVDQAQGGSTLLYCQAGTCNARADIIVPAIGLTMSDLYDEPLRGGAGGRSSKSPERRRAGQRRGKLGRLPEAISASPIVKTQDDHEHVWAEIEHYDYVDRDGRLVQRVLRQECSACAAMGRRTKNFPQVFFSDTGRTLRRAPKGFQRVLYRAPAIAAAVGTSPIYLVEGEKDVHTAERLGLIATTNTQGAGSFPAELAGEFSGADVVVVLDRDPMGWARGVDLHAKLAAAGARVRLCLPAVNEPKSDLTDHIDAGFGIDALIDVHVEEVAAWHGLTAVRDQNKLFEQAIREAYARHDRAENGEETEANRRFAKRWVLESQIRQEALQHKVELVVGHAVQTGTVWAVEAMQLADGVLRVATEAAYRCHRQLGVPAPPSLRPSPTEGAEQTPAAADADETAASPSVDPGSDEDPTWEAGPGANIAAPIFRVLNGQIVQWEADRTARRRSDDWDEEEPPGKFKVLLTTVVRVTCREYLEVNSDTDVEQVELMGRADPKRKPVSAPRMLSAVRLEFPDPVTGELMEIRVHADQWRDHSWLESLPGHPDYDHKRAGLDQLQRAILAVSPNVTDEVLYRTTGWREMPDGSHRFIHRRGAITADGHESVEVAFSGPMERYDLPDPTCDADRIRDAWLEGSATILDRLPERVAAPLLGQVFRAVLGHNEWVLTLVGPPGSYKTSVAAKAMQHFGERWEHKKPTSSMSGNGDTFNALRLKLHHAKDCLYWMDDFAPTKSWLEAQKNLEESARLVHNQEERSRSSRDGLTISDGTGPRSSALCTSEVMPRPGSAADRMLVVPIARDEVDTARLFPLDEPLSRHRRALVMSSFISWLAADLRGRRQHYFQVAAEYADQMVQQQGETVRQAAAIANTWIGWVAVTDFLVESRAITPDERQQTLLRVDQALGETARSAHNPDMPRTTGARVRELLAFALRQGIAYVDDVRTGQCPPWPLAGRLGWRQTVLDTDPHGINKVRNERSGMRLGYVLHNPTPRERGRLLMCESTQLEAVLKAASATQAEKLEIDRTTACRALRDEGVLVVDESEGRTRHTVHCAIYAEERSARMTALHLDKIIGDEPDDDGQPAAPAGGGTVPVDGSCVPGPTGHRAKTPADKPPGLDPADPHPLDSPAASVDAGSLTDDHHAGEADGSDQPDEEESVTEEYRPSRWTDRDGTVGWTQAHEPGDGGLCVVCRVRSSVLISGAWVHPLCWERSTAAERIGHDAAASTRLETSAGAEPAPPEAAGRPATRPTARTEEFRAAAAIVGPDRIWLSNGEQIAMPGQGPRHIGDLVKLAAWLKLGTFVTKPRKDGGKRRSVAGQIWITDELARSWGIDLDTISAAEERDKEKTTKAVTAAVPAVTAALGEGYSIGGADGDGLGRWSRVWKGSDRSIWVVLLPTLSSDAKSFPLIDGDPDHAALARRIGLLADALGYPYHLSASTTGLDLMSDLHYLDRDRLFAARTDLVTPEEMNVETDLSWCRKPTAEELEHTWVHAYDRSGSYLAGVSSLELGVGAPQHHPDGRTFDRKLPGYWYATVPEPGDWRMPHPLDPLGNLAGRTRWLSTPSVEFALEQGYQLDIVEAYTWPEHARVLESWYERIRDARTALDTADPDAAAARDQLKQIYAHPIGMMGSHTHMAGRPGYAPARRHMIVAKARTNILRRVAKIGEETGRWPVAVATDTVVYTSAEADPVKAWPGGDQWLGRALGRYKPEGSLPLADHLEFLTGGRYKGRAQIVGDAGAE